MGNCSEKGVINIEVALHKVMDQAFKGDALVNDLGATGRAEAVIGAQTEIAIFAVHEVSVRNR